VGFLGRIFIQQPWHVGFIEDKISVSISVKLCRCYILYLSVSVSYCRYCMYLYISVLKPFY